MNYYNNDDQTLHIAAHTAESVAGLAALTKALKSNGRALEALTNISRSFNDQGDLVQQTMTGISKAGEKVTRTFKMTEDGFRKVKEAMVPAKQEIDKYAQAIDNFRKTGELSDNVLRNRIKLLAQVQKAAKAASDKQDKETNQVNNDALKALQLKAIKSLFDPKDQINELTSLKEIERVLVNRQKVIGQLAKVEAERVKVVQQLNKEFDLSKQKRGNALVDEAIKLAKEQEKVERNRIKLLAEIDRLKAQESNRAAAQAFRTNAQSAMGPLPKDVTASNLNAMQSALATASKFIESGKLDPSRLTAIFDHVRSGATDFAALTVEEARAEAALRRYVNAYNNTGEKVQQITISWAGVLRLLEAQLLHIAIGRIFANLKQAVTDAAELSIKVAEIQTISQKANVGTVAWTKSLRELSDAFGEDVLVVAEGAYETISNQIAKGADTTKFMADAMKFAQATVSNTAVAVDLLSAAINSYGKTTNQSREIAAQFFKAIDLGRIRADQLSGTFGNVTALAAQMGVSLKEVLAALATLTIQGVAPDTAMTLLTNTLKSLLKPTKEMTKFLKDYGFASGEAAIQTIGFVGVLKLLEKELATGGTTRIAELDDDLRELRGTLGLVNKSAFADFEKALGEMSNGLGEYDKAVNLVADSMGKKWNIELNKAANILKIDFGQKGLEATMKVIDAMGGLDNILKAVLKTFNLVGSSVGGIITGFGLLNNASDSTKDAVGQLVVALGELYLANKLLETKGMAWAGAFKSRILIVLAALELLNLEYEHGLSVNAEAVKNVTKAFDELNKVLADAANAQFTEEMERFNKELTKANINTKDLSTAFEERLNKSLEELKDKEYAKELEKVADAIRDIQESLAKRMFEFNAKADGASPFEGMITEIQRISKAVDEALAAGDFEHNRELWDDLTSAVEKYNDTIQSKLNESLKETRDILKDIEERNLDKSLKGKSATDQIDILKQHLIKLEGEAFAEKDIEKSRKIFEQMEDDIKRVQKLEDEFNKKAKKAGMPNLETDIAGGLTDQLLQDRLNREEQERKNLPKPIDEKKSAEAHVSQEEYIKQQLELQNKAVEAKNELLKKQIELMGQIVELNNSISTAEGNRKNNIQSAQAAGNDANAQLQGVGAALQSAANHLNAYEHSPIDNLMKDIANLDTAKASHNIQTIEAALAKLNKSLEEYRKSVGDGKNFFGSEYKITDTMTRKDSVKILEDNIKKYQAALQTLRDSEKQGTAIDDAKKKVADLNAQYIALIESVKGLPNNQGKATRETIGYIDEIIAAIARLTEAIKGIPSITVPLSTSGEGAGRPGGFASGGLLSGPPGRDNMFVKAHSGEFIMNTASTQKFYSQLVAMNSGFTPRGFANGGGVNIQGGINVSVTGQPSTEQTARDLGQAIRRGIRNRTIRLS